jgi:hypothetical protein
MAHPCGQSWRIGSLPCQSTAAARTASKMRRRVGVSSAIFGNLILNDLCARLVFQKTDYAAFFGQPARSVAHFYYERQPVQSGTRCIFTTPVDGRARSPPFSVTPICATLPQNGRKMMARRIAYSLISVFGVLLAIGSACAACHGPHTRAKSRASRPRQANSR